ncbi:MAG: recombinase family protein [Nitrososphaeria archaeon]
MTLAFGYVRASTLDEVKQGSNERQKEEILRYAQPKGYDIEFFEDLNWFFGIGIFATTTFENPLFIIDVKLIKIIFIVMI